MLGKAIKYLVPLSAIFGRETSVKKFLSKLRLRMKMKRLKVLNNAQLTTT
jgi:hypothetical protein